jgi:hypothetical protein
LLLLLPLLTDLENDGVLEGGVREVADVLLLVLLLLTPLSVILVLPLNAEELLLLLLVIGVVDELSGVAEDERT